MPYEVLRTIRTVVLTIGLTVMLAVGVRHITLASSAPAPTLKVMPVWKALLLIYHNTDVTYTDSDGSSQYLNTTLSNEEVLKALWAFRQYTSIAHDFSAGEALVQYDVVHIVRPITSISSLGDWGYWVSPSDIEPELDAYASPDR